MAEFIAGLVCIALSVYMFWRAINYLRLVRIVEDTPRSNIASASQGMVEVKGKTLPLENQVLMVPRKNIPCVWYRYVVTINPDDDELSESEVKESHERFFIADHTGQCAIDPWHAEIHTKKQDTEYEGNYKHEVSWIGIDEYVYVLGWMNSLHPAPKTGDVITVRGNKTHRYGQLEDKLDRITRSPHGWLPFIISSHFEHKLVGRFKSLFISWSTGAILLLIFSGILIAR